MLADREPLFSINKGKSLLYSIREDGCGERTASPLFHSMCLPVDGYTHTKLADPIG